MQLWFERNKGRKQVMLAFFLACTSFILSGYHYAKQVKDEAFIAPDQPVQFVQIQKQNQTQLFAFSSRHTDSSVIIHVTGKNIRVTPSLPVWRGLSANDKDPIVSIESLDPDHPKSFSYFYEFHPGTECSKPQDDFKYSLPYERSSKFRIVQGYFGPTHKRGSVYEYAVDFGLAANTLVCAARSGKVCAFRDDSIAGGREERFSSSANYIIIKHEDNSFAEYLHLKKNGVLVKLGDRVEAGQCIALSGDTGQCSGPHLHLCVFYYDKAHQRHSLPISFKTAAGINNSPKIGQVLAHPAR